MNKSETLFEQIILSDFSAFFISDYTTSDNTTHNMAKAMSAEQLEGLLSTVLSKAIPEIMTKMLEKFEMCFDRLLSRFDDKLDKYYGDLHDTNVRLDRLEQSLDDIKKSCADTCVKDLAATSHQYGSTQVEQKTDTALQVLMAMETEKAERAKRKRNVIISGLKEVDGVPDDEVFATFCEENLTVKPKPISCRRIGRTTATGDKPRKLKVTLSSDTAAEDLISASTILHATSSTQRHVYFNHDLTPMEAQAAFETRQSRKTGAKLVVGSSEPA